VDQVSVALLGLGTMGNGMAANLLKAGFSLAIYNRTASKAERFAAQGARIATSPADAAEGASVILAMLSDDVASRVAWLGPEGALAAAEPGAVLIECSTVSPPWTAELAAQAVRHKLEFLDAPVTGSRTQAESGQLIFLVGGSEAALAGATPVLRAMSKDIVHLGPSGSGARMKLINNFLCGVQVASLAQAIGWIERSGLDRDKALEILKAGAPGSPLLGAVSTRMVDHDYVVNFLLRLMSKDLQYAHADADTIGIDLTTATSAQALFDTASTHGFAEQDMSSVVEVLRSLPGK
jgi:3-hydroxyisobutyrate dehydrogenase